MNIILKKIYKRIGRDFALRDIDLEIFDKEFFVIIGPSGSGKTTLLRIIAGLEKPDYGKIYFDDKDVTNLSPSKRNLSFVFQNYALFPHFTIKGNLSFPLWIKRLSEEVIEEEVKRTVEEIDFSLERYLSFKPKELSAGHKQRTALGKAVIKKPSLFLFDEPLSQLDAKIRVKTRLEMKKLIISWNITTIYVTSDQQEAQALADRIAIINNGIIEQVGTYRELYEKPKNIFVASFLGTPFINLFPALYYQGEIIFSENLKIKILKNLPEKLVIGIRPEDILVNEKEGALRLKGKVVQREIITPGLEEWIEVETDIGVIRIKGRNPNRWKLKDNVDIYLDPNNFYFFNEKGENILRI
ncbi:MAG: ABC transporter ATP-binding protein [Dictyoglomaceae bacterium]